MLKIRIQITSSLDYNKLKQIGMKIRRFGRWIKVIGNISARIDFCSDMGVSSYST